MSLFRCRFAARPARPLMTRTDMLLSGSGAASVIGLMMPSSIPTVTAGRPSAGAGSASHAVEYAT
jgi:hypothetical protein